MSEKIKVRVLIEQRARPFTDRHYLPSGEVAEIDTAWAAELLSRGDAELAEAAKPQARTEKRPTAAAKREER